MEEVVQKQNQPKQQRKTMKQQYKGFKDTFKQIDLFGESVQLTYKGATKYKSPCGAFLTIIMFALVIFYSYQQLYQFISRENPYISKLTKNLDLNKTKPIDVGAYGFNFAIALNINLLPTTGYFELQHVSQTSDYNERDSYGQPLKNQEITNVPLVTCNASTYSENLWMEASQLGLGNFLCPSSKNFTLQGTYYTKKFQFIRLSLKKCINDSSTVVCDSKEDIEDFFKQNSYINLALIESYFDEENYENPIQQYISDNYAFSPQPNKSINMNIYLKQNILHLRDNYFTNKEETLIFISEGTYGVYEGSQRDRYGNEVLDVCNIFFRLSSQQEIYEREVRTISNYLSDIGGFYQILAIAATNFLLAMSFWHIDISIGKKLYQIDTSSNKKADRKVINEAIDQKQFINEVYAETISDTIINRIPIRFLSSPKLLILRAFYRLPLMCCCCKKQKRKVQRMQFRLLKELDIVRLLKSIRQLKVLIRLNLNSPQKFMINYQKAFLIETDSSQSEDVNKAYSENLKSTKRSKREQSKKWLYELAWSNFTGKQLTKQDQIILKTFIKRKFKSPEVEKLEFENAMVEDLQQLPHIEKNSTERNSSIPSEEFKVQFVRFGITSRVNESRGQIYEENKIEDFSIRNEKTLSINDDNSL